MIGGNFKEYLEKANGYESLTREYTNKLCEILTDEAPSDNEWYYRNRFFCVDVVKKDYDNYMSFIEDVVGCSYCHIMNSNGLTFMVSLTTLYDKVL